MREDNKYKKPIIMVDRIISLNEICQAIKVILEKENRPITNITLTSKNFKQYFEFYRKNIYKDLQARLPDYRVLMRFYIAELLPL